MKKLYGLALITSMVMIGCLKNEEVKPCTPKTVESEKAVMTEFAADSSINVTTDPSGVMYEVIDPGTGPAPTASSKIIAKYTLRLMDGTLKEEGQFQQPYSLGGLIEGWKIGIPKINEGGKIKLIIPSSLGYGCNPASGIPNQPLYFYIELVKVENS